MKIGRIIAVILVFCIMGTAGIAAAFFSFSNSLPQMIKVEDYKPLLVSEVFARGGEKIGEFARENRIVLPYDKIPKRLVQAFVAAEDDTFFQHGGINYVAIMRAFLVNLTSGEKRQGASTITQQVARSLLLSSEKTYTRKIKEILLSYKMEQNLKKEEILYLYLNQIYFGEGAYGVAAAADTYFRKTVDKLTLAEMAVLAGLPQAPSSYSPTDHPLKAKARQRYVLTRMAATGTITKVEAEQAVNEPIKVFLSKEYKQVAPYFVETIRQLLVQQLGEKAVLDEGLKIYTSIDFTAQQDATNQVKEGLRSIDKRQGFRGPLRHIDDAQEQNQFLLANRKAMKSEKAPIRIIKPDGNIEPEQPIAVFHKRDAKGSVITNIPDYVNKNQIVEALVAKVDDKDGLVTVRFGDGIGLIDIGEMNWARKPDATVNSERIPPITKPSAALKVGDIILIRVVGDQFSSERFNQPPVDKKKKAQAKKVEVPPNLDLYAHVELEQNPIVEGSLISFDNTTSEVLAMVGGYEFVRNKNEFNRTIQAKRQTGSAFKTIVYASALDKAFTAASPIQDAPIVFENQAEEGQEETTTWKPHNHGQKFMGDILFRNALIHSLNIPTIKILEKVGIPWVTDYAKRLGVFSTLNPDFSMGLGSSSLTLYEMTKVFSHFARLGQRIRPLVLHKVLSPDGTVLLENLSLDKRFEKDINEIDTQFEDRRKTALADALASQAQVPGQETEVEVENGASDLPDPAKIKTPKIFFENPDQLISPQTAYLMTTLLSGVIWEEGGTAARARSLGRPSAGKTGSTNGYFDGWFVGYTPQVSTGVWVGFDAEKSLGVGEVGGHTALPIWLDYMKSVHKNLPVQDFTVPANIVFANIDNQTGKLASASSSAVIKQAFVQGTEPKELSGSPSTDDETEFLKKDLTD